MSAFDTVELQPITEPIPPDPSFDWVHVFMTVGLALLVIVLIGGVGALCFHLFKRFFSHRKPPEIREIRMLLFHSQKNKNSLDDFDMDKWWPVLERYLLLRGIVQTDAPSLEEILKEVKSGTDGLKYLSKVQLVELIDMVETHRYRGTPELVDRARAFELFVKIFQEILSTETPH